MDEQRRAEILERALATLEDTAEFLAPRRREPEESQPEQTSWTPRNVARHAPLPAPVRKASDAMISRQVDQVSQHFQQHVAQDRQEKANIANALNALADEAGAETGKLQKQIAELQSQLNETRGEIALLRALQPKRLLSRKSGIPQIEGSLIGQAAVN
jgi:hypothetical protein